MNYDKNPVLKHPLNPYKNMSLLGLHLKHCANPPIRATSDMNVNFLPQYPEGCRKQGGSGSPR
jgi:hypothetical protein